MVRQLKTFVTSLGFFEEAIAAPSMKAALDAWGSSRNLFQQGFAKETDDPAIVAAAMKQPGVVLKRPIGTTGPFKEHAELPKSLSAEPTVKKKAVKPSKSKSSSTKKINAASLRKAAEAYEHEKKRRERQRQQEDAAQAKAAKQRKLATAKAEAAFEQSASKHQERLAKLEGEQATISDKIKTEESNWNNEKDKLQAAIEKAKN